MIAPDHDCLDYEKIIRELYSYLLCRGYQVSHQFRAIGGGICICVDHPDAPDYLATFWLGERDANAG